VHPALTAPARDETGALPGRVAAQQPDRAQSTALANALAESFVDSFKTELISDRVWRSRSQLELAVVEYIGWFNNAHLHEERFPARRLSQETRLHRTGVLRGLRETRSGSERAHRPGNFGPRFLHLQPAARPAWAGSDPRYTTPTPGRDLSPAHRPNSVSRPRSLLRNSG
jgi:hypothetical protein